MLDVTIFTADHEDGIEFPSVNRVSFVNAGTHGALPAIDSLQGEGTVLFVNPGNILAMEVSK